MQRTMSVRRGVVLALVLALFPSLAGTAGATAGTTYYVDATTGSDDRTGRSPGSAWRSLDKVNETTFGPGDRVLLRAGHSWQGQLWPKGSGEPGRPVVLGRYGRGAKPAVHDGGAVRLFNQPLRVAAEPPAVDAGITVPDSGGVDYTGQRVDRRPDIGAFEYRQRT